MILSHHGRRRQGGGTANIAGAGASAGKAADIRRIDGASRLAGEDDALPILLRIDLQNSGHQGLCIRRAGIGEDRIRGAAFHHLAQIHNGHVLGNMFDQGQIVGNKQIGQPEFLPQIQKQIADLGMDGHVQSGGRLIADDQLRIGDESPGDGNSLALAAGELEDIPIQIPERQSHLFHQSGGPFS